MMGVKSVHNQVHVGHRSYSPLGAVIGLQQTALSSTVT